MNIRLNFEKFTLMFAAVFVLITLFVGVYRNCHHFDNFKDRADRLDANVTRIYKELP